MPSIERIMKSPYFDATNQQNMKAQESSKMLQSLMKHDSYDYVLLLTKYFDKNSMMIEQGINTPEREWEHHPLIALLESGRASEKWLMLYFDMLEKCKMRVPQDVLKKAIDSMDSIKLKKEEEREKCTSILKRHFE